MPIGFAKVGYQARKATCGFIIEYILSVLPKFNGVHRDLNFEQGKPFSAIEVRSTQIPKVIQAFSAQASLIVDRYG